jgi:CHAD domain-containing protein
MAEGKWIAELTATTPLVDAARRVLAVRLQVVRDYLPLALQQWQDDPEHIHQLRVSTRRGGAALAIFADCLPHKSHNTMRKHLRNLRRAAGAARDWDVFAQALAEREGQTAVAHRPGLDFLIGYSQGQRMAAQQALENAAAGSPFEFDRLLAETLAALRPPPDQPQLQTLSDLAEPWIGNLVNQLHVAASDNLDQYEHLHQVRILGKRLRYGMEIFAGCFDPEFKERDYPMIEAMQEILGRANDSHVAEQRLTLLRALLRATRPGEWKRFRAGIEGLLRYHQRRLPEQRKAFLKWWAQWQDMPLARQGLSSHASHR